MLETSFTYDGVVLSTYDLNTHFLSVNASSSPVPPDVEDCLQGFFSDSIAHANNSLEASCLVSYELFSKDA